MDIWNSNDTWADNGTHEGNDEGYILSGVFCNAKECKYNYEANKCVAPSISVVGDTAHTTPETSCDTFMKS